MPPEILKGILFGAFWGALFFFLYRKDRATVWLLVLIAFIVRFLISIGTEYVHLPEHYVSDPQRYHLRAWEIASAWQSHRSLSFVESFGHLNYERVIAAVYFFTGPSILVAKAINCLLGALTVGVVWKLSSKLAGSATSAKAAFLFALWPSIVFISSQNYRDTFIIFLFLSSIYFLVTFAGTLKLRHLGLSVILIAISGLLRPEVPIFFALALMLWSIGGVLRRRETRFIFPLLLAFMLIASGWYFSPTIKNIKILKTADLAPIIEIADLNLITNTAKKAHRTMLQKISSTRPFIVKSANPRPESTLFEDLEFKSWPDLFKFIPRGVFYILFMPLPGLYPLTNTWRLMSAAENVFLLLLSLLAVRGFIMTWKDSGHWFVLFLMAVTLSIHALVEPDLGTAMRHKIYYLPFIFTFAAYNLSSRSKQVARAE